MIYDLEETFFPFAKKSRITLPKEPEGAEIACEGINAFVRNEVWDELENDLLHQGGQH